MRRVAMFLCLVLALGWLSDTGMLTIRFNDGWQFKGIPIKQDYLAVFGIGNRVVKFDSRYPLAQVKMFGMNGVHFYANGKMVPATRLGNGWLFKFDEVRESSTNPNK